MLHAWLWVQEVEDTEESQIFERATWDRLPLDRCACRSICGWDACLQA